MTQRLVKKILIIDASTLIEKIMSDNRQYDAAMEFRTVKSADLALVELIRWHPDLIITSIEVGNINGFDLCLIVRMMPDFSGIPIILMSSGCTKSLQSKASEAGADYYIKKDQEGFAFINKIVHDLCNELNRDLQQRVAQRSIINVLLVDDSKTMRKIIKNILIGIGIKNVYEAKDGQDGLQQLEAHAVDMIISDWSMPVMNGVEMIKKIRQNAQYDPIPIVMVSAEVEEEIEKAMSLGINDYLRKPFNTLAMKELITKFSCDAG